MCIQAATIDDHAWLGTVSYEGPGETIDGRWVEGRVAVVMTGDEGIWAGRRVCTGLAQSNTGSSGWR